MAEEIAALLVAAREEGVPVKATGDKKDYDNIMPIRGVRSTPRRTGSFSNYRR
jgi:hypothetical protein